MGAHSKKERPKPEVTTTEFLEIDEVVALLKALETTHTRHVPLRTIVMTLLLTGGRLREVLGLQVEDIDFRRKVIHIRKNRWRSLKRGVERTVPLWPQLETELRSYLAAARRIGQSLLFPGESKLGAETMLWGKFYKGIAEAATRAGISKRVTPQSFRVTYCSARLQTLDGGAPISLFTVRNEMGHASTDMIERVYGRLGSVRNRSEAVEYLEKASDDEFRKEVAL